MALGEIAKQLAGQAIRNQTKEVLDALGSGTPAPAQPETLSAVILGQVQAMQKALKEDEELVVVFHAGVEGIRIMQFFVPSPHVVVLTGTDAEKNLTRIVSPPESLQLVCKVMKVPPPAKPARIVFTVPK